MKTAKKARGNHRLYDADRKISDISVNRNSDGSLDLAGAQATGADVERLRGAVDYSLDTSDIGLPGTVGFAVRVGNGETELNGLSADFTFCHDFDLLNSRA